MKHLIDVEGNLLISWEDEDLPFGKLMKLSFLCWCNGIELDDCEIIDEGD